MKENRFIYVNTPPTHPEGESPEEPLVPEQQAAVEAGQGLTRRFVTRVLTLLGVTALADQITGGAISRLVSTSDEGNHPNKTKTTEQLNQEMETEAKKIADKINSEPGLSDQEKLMKTIDYAGTALFAWGVRDLLPGGHGNIHLYHYGVLLGLTSIKYMASDSHGREHLEEETVANLKAFGIISGTMAIAEGLNFDIEKAYELEKGRKAENKDKVALVTTFSSLLSPFATTVGSASIIRKMSNDLAWTGKTDEKEAKVYDKDMVAVLESHVSNLSGYLLFGDPPFIAICEKYGFKEGMAWQFKTMWPLALYSLISSTYKINYFLNKKAGLDDKAARAKSIQDSLSGIASNIGVMAKITAKSMLNVAKYMGIAFDQDAAGVEVKIGEVLLEKLKNLAKLPFSTDFDFSHDGHIGLTHEDPAITKAFGSTVEHFTEEVATSETHIAELECPESPAATLKKAIGERDFEQIETIYESQGKGSSGKLLIKILQDMDDNRRIDESTTHPREKGLRDYLNPITAFNEATDLNRIKNALGHNLGDVINVFPFQAGCVPFLVTPFKDIANSLSHLHPKAKEIGMFFLIMMFSMVADNYVACKVGLEIFPEQPHIPLIAAIQGGSMTAIGNMANVAQFGLDQYSLADSLKKIGIHVKPVVASLIWSQILNQLNAIGIWTPPKLKLKTEEQHARKETLEQKMQTPASRRDFLRGNFGGKKQAEDQLLA